jgi:carbamoyl-phosphate synthase large subunit
MNILISGVGGPTPRSIARSLKHSSIFNGTTLIGTDINPHAHGLYQSELYEKTYIIPAANQPGYWNNIIEIIEKHDIKYAFVHPEHEVLAWSQRVTDGLELPCKVLLPDHRLNQLLIDKSKMTEVLEYSGLVPISVDIDPHNIDYEKIESALNYPFWIRSTSGSSGLGSLKIENRESLQTWIYINPNVSRFIASEFLSGRNLACKLLYWNGSLIRSACGERVNYIMSKVAPSGITGNTSYGRLLNEPSLVNKATRAVDLLVEKSGCKKHGFFTADFKEDANGKPFITEINVRMVAFNWSFAAAGANFSEDILCLLSDQSDFDQSYKMYDFEQGTIFLRDVDGEPILLNERDIMKQQS